MARPIIVLSFGALLAGAGCAKDPLPAPAPAPAPAPDPPSANDVIDDFPAASVPLDQIKLVSVALGTNPTATIELPNKTQHVVKVGSMIGRSFGQVKAIREGEVVVEEEKRDAQGMRHAYEVIMHP